MENTHITNTKPSTVNESNYFTNGFTLERFSYDCRKINVKIITPTNHNRSKQWDEPIRIPCDDL